MYEVRVTENSFDAMTDRPPASPLLEDEYDHEMPVSTAVVEAVAAVENVDPTALVTAYDETLFDRVDPEALDTLASGSPDASPPVIEFAFYEYWIRIEDDDRVLVYDSRDDPAGDETER